MSRAQGAIHYSLQNTYKIVVVLLLSLFSTVEVAGVNAVKLGLPVNQPVGVAYQPNGGTLVFSVNLTEGPPGPDVVFNQVSSAGVVSQYSAATRFFDEVKVEIVQQTLGGFVAGELFCGTGNVGEVAKISADGSTVYPHWLQLNDFGVIRGGLHHDTTGVFGNNLIVVTTAGGVYKVTSAGVATKLATITEGNSVMPLEGVTTVTNNSAKYGPWSGKIIVGCGENLGSSGKIYDVSPGGAVQGRQISSAAGIVDSEDLDIIPNTSTMNFYVVNLLGFGLVNDIYKIAGTELVQYADDILATVEGDGGSNHARLVRIHWNGTTFDATDLYVLSTTYQGGADPDPDMTHPGGTLLGHFEHGTFAPIDVAVNVPKVSVVATDSIASEADLTDTAVLHFTRTGNTDLPLTINYTLSGGIYGTEFVFSPGSSSSQTFPSTKSTLDVIVTPRSGTHPTKNVTLTLTDLASYDPLAPSSAVFTIISPNDTVISLDAMVPAVPEYSNPAKAGQFRITRSGNRSASTTVNWTLSGTATSSGVGQDYSLDKSSASFPAGDANPIFVNLTPVRDTSVEGSETATMTINTGSYVRAGKYFDTVTIEDGPYVQVTAVTSKASEEKGGNGQFKFSRNDSLTTDLQVLVNFGGVALLGEDYVLQPQQGLEMDDTANLNEKILVFPAGQRDFIVTVVTIDDSRAEGQQSIIATVKPSFRTPADYLPSTTAGSATINIQDTDFDQIPDNGWLFKDLGIPFGVGSLALGINATNGIAGYCFNSVNPSYRGMLWVNSGFSYPKYEPTSFMTQPGHWSQVYGINNSGTVVGNSTWFSNPTYHQEASVWFAGLSYPTLLPTLFDMNSLDNLAIAINRFDSVKQVGGDIVGNQKTQNGTVHASLWQRQPDGSYPSVWDLGSIGGATKNSYATAINEFNEVVGKSQGFAFTSYHAFRTTPFGDVDGTADMGTGMSDDSRSSEGNDINSLGEMVGASDFAANPNPISYAAYKAPGSPKDFGWHALGMLPQGTNSVAKGIGKLGLIVGASNGRAIVFSNAGDPGTQTPLDLNNYSYVDLGGGNLQLVTLNGWTLLSAEKINDSNCIVGSAYKAGQTKAFLLTPRP